MKLFRWSLAGAGAYAIYKYSIGKKAKGEPVFESPEQAIAEAGEGEPQQQRAPKETAKRRTRAKRGKDNEK